MRRDHGQHDQLPQAERLQRDPLRHRGAELPRLLQEVQRKTVSLSGRLFLVSKFVVVQLLPSGGHGRGHGAGQGGHRGHGGQRAQVPAQVRAQHARAVQEPAASGQRP